MDIEGENGGKSRGVYFLNWMCRKSRYSNLIKQEMDLSITMNHNPGKM